MIKISPFTPLFFDASTDEFGSDSRYMQLFATDDIIVIEVVTTASEPVSGSVVNAVSDEVLQMSFTEVAVDGAKYHYSRVTGLKEGCYYADLCGKRSEMFRIVGPSELDGTTLIQYTSTNNNSRNDVLFANGIDQIEFSFRVHGGFKDDDWAFSVNNEQFELGNGNIVELFAVESTQKAFTLGNASGCPIWFGEHLNRILCCTTVHFNGVRFVRKGNSAPEVIKVNEGVKSYVFRVQLQGMVENVDVELPSEGGGEPSGGGEGYVYLIKLNDSTQPTDANTFSALRTMLEIRKAISGLMKDFDSDKFIRKDRDDATNFFLKMLQGADFGKFVPGLLGSGARIDKDGNIEARSITAWEGLRAPVFILNKVDVVSGELWSAVAKGEIKSVDAAKCTATLKLESGDYSGLKVGDYCRGIFNNIESTVDGNEDECGFLTEVGFSTSYFEVTELLVNERGNCTFRYRLRTDETFPPCAQMRFVVYTNPQDVTRQASAYFNRRYLRFMDKVDGWVIDPNKHVYAQFGDLSGLNINGQQLASYGIFLSNVYFKGVQIQLTDEQINQMTPYTVSLSAENFNIRVDTNGAIVGKPTLRSKIQVVKGSRLLVHGVIEGEGIYTTDLVAAGCRASVSDDGVVTISDFIDGQETYAVTVTVKCEQKVSFGKTINIQVVMDGQKGQDGVGHDGKSPVIYQLIPFVDFIKIDKAGRYSVSHVKTRVTKIEGDVRTNYDDSLPAGCSIYAYVDGTRVSFDMSNGVLVSGARQNVSLELYLSDRIGTMLVDKEILPVLIDGADGSSGESPIVANLTNDFMSVACDSTGVPVGSSGGYLTTQPFTDICLFRGVDKLIIKRCDVALRNSNDASNVEWSCYPIDDSGQAITGPSSYYRLALTKYLSVASDTVYLDISVVADIAKGKEITRTIALTIARSKQGNDGKGEAGVSPLAMNLSNDTIVVMCDATGQAQGTGENDRIPPEFQPSTIISMYQGTTHLMIDTIKVEFVEEGLYNKVSAYSEKITDGGTTGDIKLSITTLTAAAPDVCHLKLTASTKSKLRISSNVTIQKVHPSATTPIYQIVPSHQVIKVDKDGVYSANRISAHVVEYLGDKVTEYKDSLPSGLRVVCKIDGVTVSFGLSTGADVTGATSNIVLDLIKAGKSAVETVIDKETVPVLIDGSEGQDGVNGVGFVEIFKLSNTCPETPQFRIEQEIGNGWSKTAPNLSTEQISFSTESKWQLNSSGYYECPPVGNSQMGKEILYFDFNEDVYIDIEVQVNSEPSYDFAFVGKLNERYNQIPDKRSGNLFLSGSHQTAHVSVLVPSGMNNLSILYCKDSSNSAANEYCRFRVIGIKRIWSSRSESRYDSQRKVWEYSGWSTPRLVNLENGEEKIYLLRAQQGSLSIPYSDPDIDRYLPPLTEEQWNDTTGYLEGNEVAYNGNFYEAIRSSTGIVPTDSEYWKPVPTWTSEPSEVTDEYKYQYFCIRQQKNTVWQPWSTPVLFNAANEKGSQGVDGVSYLKITWAPGIDFLDGKTIVDGVYLQHIAMIRNKAIASGWEAYTCLVAHTSSKNFQADFDKGYWHKMAQNIADMYANLIIAQNAIIDLFQGNQILIKKDNGTITLGLSGSEAGNKIRLWAGAQLPDGAPFTVDELGRMYAQKANIEGDVTIGCLKMKVTPALPIGSYQPLDKSSCIVKDGCYLLPQLGTDTFTEIKVYVSTSASRSIHPIWFRFPTQNNSLRIIHFGGIREYEAVNEMQISHSGGVIRMRIVGIAEADGRQNWSVTYEGALNEQSFYIKY